MKISVIIPVFNAQNTLKKCVCSILCQRCTDLEIILVDDYSQDDSLNICKEFQKNSSLIFVYQSEGKGVSDARNTGLMHATGDVVGFCDADDMYESSALSVVEEIFNNNAKLDIVVSGFSFAYFTDHLEIRETRHCRKPYLCGARKLLELVIVDNRIMGSVCNKFYRSSVINGIYFNNKLTHCEDMDYNVQMLKKNPNCNCFITDLVLYYYIHNTDSATNSIDKLFDKYDKLNYINAMKEIEHNIGTEEKLGYLVGFKIASLAINALYQYNLDSRKSELLKVEIKNNFGSFIIGIFRNIKQGGFKLMLKLICVYIKSTSGNEDKLL